MRPVWFALPLLFALAACDNTDTPTPVEPVSAPAPQDATETQEGLAGIWRPQGENPLHALVLEKDGQLYLVGDQGHRGVRWEKQDDDTLVLNYLNTRDDEPLNQDPLTVTLDNPSLTLAGEGPFAGEYRRDATGVGTLEGQVILPDDADIPDTSVLVLTLRDQTAADATPLVQRLTRLGVEDGKMPFRLYYNGDNIDDTHRYVLDARVILDGAVQFTTTAPHRVLDGVEDSQTTLSLHAATAEPPFADTYWKLIQVGDEQTPPPENQNRQAHLVFHSEGQQVKGNTGCNSLSAGYQNEDGRLTLEPLTTTERACSGPNQAQAFTDALARTQRFEVQGQRLTLYGEGDQALAILQAEYLF